jgi:D-glycero-D-manno-heptose 1,7-bisphosphate phosphatase
MSYIFLDRDGVINYDSDEYIKSAEEWHAIPGSLEAIASLNRAGYKVLVVSNQSGLARGLFDLDALNQMHKKFIHELAAVGGYVEEIIFCPHLPSDDCECRKPKPGMFYQLQKKYHMDFTKTYFVGDTMADVQVAKIIGCYPLLVLTGKGKKTLDAHPEYVKKIPCFLNLSQAAKFVLENPFYA